MTDSAQTPIPNVTISYSDIGSTLIKGFSQTNASGRFSLALNTTEDSVTLTLRHINYQPQTKKIKNIKQQQHFVLTISDKTLPEVVIEPTPIYKRNDTINYNVSAFASKEDRVIGDIINLSSV